MIEYLTMNTIGFDLNSTVSRYTVGVGPYSVATFQAVLTSGSWGSTVLTVQRSNDGLNWVGLESAVTLSGEGMTAAINTEGFAYLGVFVTTAAGGAATASLHLCAKALNVTGA